MLSLPGPSAVLSLAGRARSTAALLLGLPGRAIALVDRAEQLVDRVDALLAAVEAVAARAALVAAEAEAVAGRAGEVAAGAGTVVVEAGRVARVAGTIAADRRGVVAATAETERSAAALVGGYEPTLRALQPTLTRLAETVDPREVEAMVALVDRLPRLLDSVDTDMLPLLSRLNQMAPDLHAVLDAVEDLRRVVAGLPGVGVLMRRGDEELAAADSEPGTALQGASQHGATQARP